MIIHEKELHPSAGLIFLILLLVVGGLSVAWLIRSARAEQALPSLLAYAPEIASPVIGPPLR